MLEKHIHGPEIKPLSGVHFSKPGSDDSSSTSSDNNSDEGTESQSESQSVSGGGADPPDPDGNKRPRPENWDPEYGTTDEFARRHLVIPSDKPQTPSGHKENDSEIEGEKKSEKKTESNREIQEKLPKYTGGKTSGILETDSGLEIPLESGRKGRASEIPLETAGFDGYTRTHAEGHAAATMRLDGIKEAKLTINNPRICPNCDKLLPRMIPEGYKLEVVLPDDTSKVFVGGQ